MNETEKKPRKPQARSWAKKRSFLAAFRLSCSVTVSAKAARIPTTEHYRWVREDEMYRKEWDLAKEEAIQALEDEAVRRAHEGVKRLVLYQGRPVRIGRKPLYSIEYSDQLLITLLKALKPEAYRERITTEVTGSLEIVDRLNAARKRLIAMDHVPPTGTIG